MTEVETVQDLIEALQELPPETKVRARAQNARSRRISVELSEGFISAFGHELPPGYHGYEEAKASGTTFPVVWV